LRNDYRLFTKKYRKKLSLSDYRNAGTGTATGAGPEQKPMESAFPLISKELKKINNLKKNPAWKKKTKQCDR